MTVRYWYVLPLAVVIATVATAIGVGGATFATPVFVLVLGLVPEVAIAAALASEVFGFASGAIAYARRRVIDYRLGTGMLVVAIPAAVLGAWLSGRIDERILKAILGVGLLVVAANSMRGLSPERRKRLDEGIALAHWPGARTTCLLTADGDEICYAPCNRAEGGAIAAVGAFFKGLIATGLGEMNDDFLLERCRVPSRISVATSLFVVLFTTLGAALTHVGRLAIQGGEELRSLASVLVFSIPGVIVGGQIGPRVADRLPRREFEWALHVLLLLVAALTLAEALL